MNLLLLQDNYPHMEYTALDLSPYYLYEARTNIKEWHRLRQPKLSIGGVDGSGVHFLQAAAESIPQPDASQDVVCPSAKSPTLLMQQGCAALLYAASHRQATLEVRASVVCFGGDSALGHDIMGTSAMLNITSAKMAIAYLNVADLSASTCYVCVCMSVSMPAPHTGGRSLACQW